MVISDFIMNLNFLRQTVSSFNLRKQSFNFKDDAGCLSKGQGKKQGVIKRIKNITLFFFVIFVIKC